jgi:hypothetical protein
MKGEKGVSTDEAPCILYKKTRAKNSPKYEESLPVSKRFLLISVKTGTRPPFSAVAVPWLLPYLTLGEDTITSYLLLERYKWCRGN